MARSNSKTPNDSTAIEADAALSQSQPQSKTKAMKRGERDKLAARLTAGEPLDHASVEAIGSASSADLKHLTREFAGSSLKALRSETMLVFASALKALGMLDKPIFGSDTLLTLSSAHANAEGESAGLGLIKDLLAMGANPKSATQYKQSPMMQAIHGIRHQGLSPNAAMARMETLLEAGCDIHHRNQVKQQVIHWASWETGPEAVRMVQWLISKGADVSSAESDGFTPLHHAAKMGNLPMARLLIEAGADLETLATDQGKQATPLGVALTWSRVTGNMEMVKLIVQTQLALSERDLLEDEMAKAAPAAERPGL